MKKRMLSELLLIFLLPICSMAQPEVVWEGSTVSFQTGNQPFLVDAWDSDLNLLEQEFDDWQDEHKTIWIGVRIPPYFPSESRIKQAYEYVDYWDKKSRIFLTAYLNQCVVPRVNQDAVKYGGEWWQDVWVSTHDCGDGLLAYRDMIKMDINRDSLLRYLQAHHQESIYRFRWMKGDLGRWQDEISGIMFDVSAWQEPDRTHVSHYFPFHTLEDREFFFTDIQVAYDSIGGDGITTLMQWGVYYYLDLESWLETADAYLAANGQENYPVLKDATERIRSFLPKWQMGISDDYLEEVRSFEKYQRLENFFEEEMEDRQILQNGWQQFLSPDALLQLLLL